MENERKINDEMDMDLSFAEMTNTLKKEGFDEEANKVITALVNENAGIMKRYNNIRNYCCAKFKIKKFKNLRELDDAVDNIQSSRTRFIVSITVFILFVLITVLLVATENSRKVVWLQEAAGQFAIYNTAADEVQQYQFENMYECPMNVYPIGDTFEPGVYIQTSFNDVFYIDISAKSDDMFVMLLTHYDPMEPGKSWNARYICKIEDKVAYDSTGTVTLQLDPDAGCIRLSILDNQKLDSAVYARGQYYCIIKKTPASEEEES